jgi:hypothetical protein
MDQNASVPNFIKIHPDVSVIKYKNNRHKWLISWYHQVLA